MDLGAGGWDQGLGWCWGLGWAERSEVELGVLLGDGWVVGAGLWVERSEAELGGYWRGVGVGRGAKRRLGVVSDSALCVPTHRRR